MAKLLIIEDNAINRELIGDILSPLHEITMAKDGYQGIQMALNHKPDLIICDIMMPKIDGYEVLKSIRNSAELSYVPFIFLTAKNEKSDLRYGMESGADDYLTKPFSATELITAIDTRLRRKEALDNELNQKVKDINNTLNTTSAHEFNTPLNAIIGFTSLMISNYSKFGKDEIINMLMTIKKSSRRLQKTTNNILLFSYLQKFNNEPASYLAGITEECYDPIFNKVKALAEVCNYEEKVSIEITNANLAISEDDLLKITEEIVSNAFIYADKNSKVEVNTFIENKLYCLKVTNMGRGISKENIEKIGPYIQFNRQQYEQQGLGLGLYLAKRLTELNNGKFIMESEENKKTEVAIYLPITI